MQTKNSKFQFRVGDLCLLGTASRLGLDESTESIHMKTRVTTLQNLCCAVDMMYKMAYALMDPTSQFCKDQKIGDKAKSVKGSRAATVVDLNQYEKVVENVLSCSKNILVTVRKLPDLLTSEMLPSQKCEVLLRYIEQFDKTVQQCCTHFKSLPKKTRENFVEKFNAAKICDDLKLFFNMLGELSQLNSKLHSNFSVVKKYGNLKNKQVFLAYESQCILWFSTIVSSARLPLSLRVGIVDEAAMVPEACMGMLFIKSIKKLVLIGDVKQLPAVVQSPRSKQHGYGISLFERLKELSFPSKLLNLQYRMHSDISKFPRDHFYKGKVLDGNPGAAHYLHDWHNHQRYQTFLFFDVVGTETRNPVTRSRGNQIEAEIIAQQIQSFSSEISSRGKGKISIGIISPYKEQCSVIHKTLMKASGATAKKHIRKSILQIEFPKLSISISSVDGFQGQERDIILISTVRSNSEGNVGFVVCPLRLNVAITRAKFSCWIFGNSSTLENASDWAALISYMNEHKKVISFSKAGKIDNTSTSTIELAMAEMQLS
jgi:hypothetical protein